MACVARLRQCRCPRPLAPAAGSGGRTTAARRSLCPSRASASIPCRAAALRVAGAPPAPHGSAPVAIARASQDAETWRAFAQLRPHRSSPRRSTTRAPSATSGSGRPALFGPRWFEPCPARSCHHWARFGFPAGQQDPRVRDGARAPPASRASARAAVAAANAAGPRPAGARGRVRRRTCGRLHAARRRSAGAPASPASRARKAGCPPGPHGATLKACVAPPPAAPGTSKLPWMASLHERRQPYPALLRQSRRRAPRTPACGGTPAPAPRARRRRQRGEQRSTAVGPRAPAPPPWTMALQRADAKQADATMCHRRSSSARVGRRATVAPDSSRTWPRRTQSDSATPLPRRRRCMPPPSVATYRRTAALPSRSTGSPPSCAT
jgi:hypothetical protein